MSRESELKKDLTELEAQTGRAHLQSFAALSFMISALCTFSLFVRLISAEPFNEGRRSPIDLVEAFGILLFFGAVGLLFAQRWGRTLCRVFYLSAGVVGLYFIVGGVASLEPQGLVWVLLGALLIGMSVLAVKFLNRESVRQVLGCRVREENPPESIGRSLLWLAHTLLYLVAIWLTLVLLTSPL